jgi:hypothetical protein
LAVKSVIEQVLILHRCELELPDYDGVQTTYNPGENCCHVKYACMDHGRDCKHIGDGEASGAQLGDVGDCSDGNADSSDDDENDGDGSEMDSDGDGLIDDADGSEHAAEADNGTPEFTSGLTMGVGHHRVPYMYHSKSANMYDVYDRDFGFHTLHSTFLLD